jgi:hypothetical protein
MTISLTRTTCLCLSAISSSWRNRVRGASINSLTKSSIPALGDCFSCRELVLCSATTRQPLAKGWTAKCIDDPDVVMLPIEREAGLNDVGMVAWLVRLKSPECPTGRELVIICNDITFQAGSFGTREDAMFFKASEFARLKGIPRFFLAANSGARIGMAQSLKSKFQVGEELSGQFIPLC